MPKIEIDNLNDLINKKYPIEYIEKLINDVLVLSMLVKYDYPNYKEWYLTKQVPGIYDGTRNIIIAHIGDQLVGFSSLKKDSIERKICTFYVSKCFRKNKIGNLLVLKSIEWLECDKPLITIPNDKIGNFIRIAKKYDWQVTDIKEGLYRFDNPEIILNGAIENIGTEQAKDKVKTKSLNHIWYFYLLTKLKTIIHFNKKLFNN